MNKLFRDANGIVSYNAITHPYPPPPPPRTVVAFPGTSDATDDNGHGTHVAGIAAAQTNSGAGIAGIAGWNGIHFTWKPEWPSVERLLPRIEAALAPFQARPHWGKLFTMQPAALQALYPRLPDFKELLHTCDPQGKFRNAFLNDTLFATP